MICRCCSIDGHDLIQNIRHEEYAGGTSNRQNQLQSTRHQTSATARHLFQEQPEACIKIISVSTSSSISWYMDQLQHQIPLKTSLEGSGPCTEHLLLFRCTRMSPQQGCPHLWIPVPLFISICIADRNMAAFDTWRWKRCARGVALNNAVQIRVPALRSSALHAKPIQESHLWSSKGIAQNSLITCTTQGTASIASRLATPALA